MILDQFEAWARTASAIDRADGVKILARAYLYSDLGPVRQDALRVLTGFLDDPSPLVRRTLAEGVAGAGHAPHHIVAALADDQAEIATVVLARSSILTDAELVACAACADEAAQVAIASRAPLGATVAAALADGAAPAALVALAANRRAVLSPASFQRLFERGGDRAELREALLTRPDLPAALRVDLVAATTRALAAFVTQRNWMSDERMRRVETETRDKAAVTISSAQGEAQVELVAHLRRHARLTVGLTLRAVLSGRLDLFTAVLAELSGTEPARARGLSARCEGAGFAALYRKAGLPDALLPAFRCALDTASTVIFAGGARLDRGAVERVIAGCERINAGELDALLVTLRRFEVEAARDEARAAGDPARKAARMARFAAPLLLPDEAERPLHEDRPERADAGRPRQATYEIDLDAIETLLLADVAAPLDAAEAPARPARIAALAASAPVPPRPQATRRAGRTEAGRVEVDMVELETLLLAA